MSEKKKFPFPEPKDLNGKLRYHAEFIPFKWKQLMEIHEKYYKEFLEWSETTKDPKLKQQLRGWAEEHLKDLERMQEKTPMMNLDARLARKEMEELR